MRPHLHPFMRAARVLALIALIWGTALPGTASAITMDTSKITATCFASDSFSGSFSSTDPITLWDGAAVALRLGYNNNDDKADTTYNASFRAEVSQSTALGAARVIDTYEGWAGQGLSTGTINFVALPATTPSTQQVTVQIRSAVTGSTVLASCNFQLTVIAVTPDIDGDGIPNDVEINGLRDSTGNLIQRADGTPAADFPSLGANPCRKDVFVEVDYMVASGHDHRPSQAAIDEVVDAFDKAPIPPLAGGCPFSGFQTKPGTHIGINVDGTLQETTTTDANGKTVVAGWGCGNLDGFDPARRAYFLYAMFVHSSQTGSSQSGLAPCFGRAFVVSVGDWSPAPNGSARAQSGSFMHELGHVFGLGHGGDPREAAFIAGGGVNLKPNYLSVMNYSFQLGIGTTNGKSVIDYSRSKLPTLDESALDEGAGIGGPSDRQTLWWGPAPRFKYQVTSTDLRPANGSLDWNQNGKIDTGTVGVDVNSDGICVVAGPNKVLDTTAVGDDITAGSEIRNGPDHICDSRPAGDDLQWGWKDMPCVTPGVDNKLDSTPAGDDATVSNSIRNGANLVCDTTAQGDDIQIVPVGRSEALLYGFDDWANINFHVGPFNTAPGSSVPIHDDLTKEQADAIANAHNQSFDFDLDVRVAVDRTEAKPGETLTYTTKVENVGTGRATSIALQRTLPGGAATTDTIADLEPGQSATRISTFVVPAAVKTSVLTMTASASGLSALGDAETVTANNTRSVSTLVRGPIAFTSTRDGNSEIYKMNWDGSNPVRLTVNPAVDADPSFSPDGTKIAFSSTRDGNSEIYRMNANGTGLVRLTTNPAIDNQPSWSPDGTKIAFTSSRDGNTEIYVMSALDGSGLVRLTNNPKPDAFPDWSPDGTQIAFTSSRDGNDEIYVMNASNGNGLVRVTSNPAIDTLGSWSALGKIAFTSTRDGNSEIYVVNPDGTGLTRVTTNAAVDASPEWSPDGAKILFSSTRDGNYEIYVMNADGSSQVRLTNNTATDSLPGSS